MVGRPILGSWIGMGTRGDKPMRLPHRLGEGPRRPTVPKSSRTKLAVDPNSALAEAPSLHLHTPRMLATPQPLAQDAVLFAPLSGHSVRELVVHVAGGGQPHQLRRRQVSEHVAEQLVGQRLHDPNTILPELYFGRTLPRYRYGLAAGNSGG